MGTPNEGQQESVCLKRQWDGGKIVDTHGNTFDSVSHIVPGLLYGGKLLHKHPVANLVYNI